jgi:enoyl-CoA hydratase/carnithine racemase
MSGSSGQWVEVRREGAVAIVTMSDERRRNPFSMDMRLALSEAIRHLMDDDAEVRAVVLTGAGGHFCAGGDLSEMTTAPSTLALRSRIAVATRLARMIATGPKPVVAAVEGSCIGAGMSLAAVCDLAIGARDAKFACAFVKVGLLPDTGLLWNLPQKIGAGRARELMLTCERFDGERAARLGLLDRVCEPGQALQLALDQARKWAEMPPVSLALLKGALVNAARDIPTTVRHEIDLNPLVRKTHDHQEAVSAFLEKRRPQFRGE